MFPPREDVLRLLPEIILSLSGIVLMLVEPFLTRARRPVLVSLAALTTIVTRSSLTKLKRI